MRLPAPRESGVTRRSTDPPRYARFSNNKAFQLLKQEGRLAQLRHVLYESARMAAMSIPKAALGVLTLPFNREKGGRRIFYATMHLASIYGYLAGVVGVQLTPYRRIDGY